MTDAQIDTRLLQERIEAYRDADPDLSEANVAGAYVARFFEALGWDTKDPLVWNRQSFVRGAGYADAALQVDHEPVLFVEVKRFGGVSRPQEDVIAPQQLFGDEPILSQAEREALGIDRTPEEKQAMRYARGAGIRWAVLTNFERLLLFNADEERVVLAFDAPGEYLERLDDLEILAPADTPEQFDGRLQWYADLQRKPEIDEDFYRFLSDWRLRLAQVIYEHNWEGETLPEGGETSYAHLSEPPLTAAPGTGTPPRHLLQAPDGSLDLDRLRRAVQRILDRLILLRYADDVGFLAQHDLLESQLVAFLGRQLYVNEYEFQQDLNRLCHAFYRQHDTSLFAPGSLCERVRVPNQTLTELVRAISAISFRKFSSDILGNTYESYLGQRLVLEGDTISAESDRALRRESGIYYTPSYIVRYIVDHTLGRWLYGTVDGRPDGEPLPDASPRSLDDLEGLRLLDPAMGSGSFLIYAFEVLADFYERENERIRRENAARWDAWGRRAMEEGMFGEDNDAPELEEPAPDYVGRILQEHLYGVDLDPEAVEIAGVNLILRAFDRLRGGRERGKLPLILGQNLKVGNSLISGVTGPDDLAPFEEERRRLIALREELRTLEEDEAQAEKLAEIEEVAAPVNAALNESLEGHFDDAAAKRPFNWQVAFPEAFDPDAQEERGFTIVVGNPPYGSRERLSKREKRYIDDHYPKTTEGPYDTYKSFTELGVRHLEEEGYFSFIIPSSYMTGKHAFGMRKLLLENTLLHYIVELGFQVFPDTSDTHMIFAVQSPARSDHFDSQLINVCSISGPDELAEEGQAISIPQKDWLDRDRNPNLFFQTQVESQTIADLIAKIAQKGIPLETLVRIREGINQGYIGDVLISARKRDERDHRMLRGGRNIGRYAITWDGEWVCYDHDLIKQYGDQARSLPPQEFFERPKILIQYSARKIIATYDSEAFYYLNLLLGLISAKADYELQYILAVLNSRLISWYFQHALADRKDIFPKVTVTRLRQIPICAIDFSDPADVAAHDRLAELAQRMLDLNETHQAATDAFAEAIRGYERKRISLQRFLKEQRDFITLHPLLDANEEGEVSAIAADEDGDGLVIRAEVEGQWRDVVRLEIEDEDLHLYLLLALRAFLYEKRRKYVWSRGKTLGGVLEALEAPRLASATPEIHQRRAARLMDDVRRLLPDDASASKLPHRDVGLDREGAPLHLSAIEADLDAADAEIDRRVYDLYALTEEEIATVEGQMGS